MTRVAATRLAAAIIRDRVPEIERLAGHLIDAGFGRLAAAVRGEAMMPAAIGIDRPMPDPATWNAAADAVVTPVPAIGPKVLAWAQAAAQLRPAAFTCHDAFLDWLAGPEPALAPPTKALKFALLDLPEAERIPVIDELLRRFGGGQ